MSAIDLLLTVYANFRQSRGRFILTLSGITIGVMLLIIMGSFLESAGQALQKSAQEAIDADLITTVPQAVPKKIRHKTTRPLDENDAHATAKSQFFTQSTIGFERRSFTSAYFQGKTKNISLSGVSSDAPDLYKLELAAGRFFKRSDFENSRRVCIIGDEVHQYFAPNGPSLLNNYLTIESNQFRVVGILKKKMFLGKTSSLDLWDRRIIIPVTTFKMDVRPSGTVDLLFIRLESFADVKKMVPLLSEQLKNLLLRRHYGIENFRLRDMSGDDNVSVLMESVISVLFIGIAGLALLVGGINIMNIMLITVTERTREIGIRRAVGCTRFTLMKQFLLESGLISLFGGLLGIILGITFTVLLTLALKSLWGHWDLIIDTTSIIAGAVVSFLTGIIFGFYPALQASRLTPDQCLRYE
ncbi:ABC transporter permease [candidate division CSSED10-310 bacterium]|uniref:ABC transporter permease n=1 Tax=candidate division CSSED10-310 bacterium TaxID=2855610 RepID=A0ABV6YSG0_UNCC1